MGLIIIGFMNIDEIIAAAGGHERIAERAQARGQKLSIYAPLKWRENGIPEKHWQLVMRLVRGLTPEDIYLANKKLRKQRAKAA